MDKPLAKYELERTEILRYLSNLSFRTATFEELLAHLDDRNYHCTDERMAFHLRYLAGKGFISISLSALQLGKEQQIETAMITPDGVDLIDQRRKGNKGMRI